jgi:hypothetical protein
VPEGGFSEPVAAPAARPADGQAPLAVRGNPMLGRYGATVCAIVHNEMFFLPAFLAHYRALGADRFVILDDRSTDGTADYLAAQPDVMVVESGIRYFQEIEYSPETLALVRETRAVRLWRDQLMDQFCAGQWAVDVDPDELLSLPDGGLPAFTAALDAEGAEAAWGVMVDMYPARVADILGAGEGARFDPAEAWYFDGKPHLDPQQQIGGPPSQPRTIYPGSVSRLFAAYGVLPQGSLVRRLRRRLSGYRYEPHQIIHKTPIVRWRTGDWFLNCHVTSKPVSRDRVVPMLHFKFTKDLGRKIEYALKTGGYNQGSRSYKLYASLIERMMQDPKGGSFLGKVSRRWTGHADLAAAGVAR